MQGFEKKGVERFFAMKIQWITSLVFYYFCSLKIISI